LIFADALARLDYRQSAAVTIPTSGYVRQSVTCETGLAPIGGGAKVSDPNFAYILDTYPLGKTGWRSLPVPIIRREPR
jgi:hypothetical protein